MVSQKFGKGGYALGERIFEDGRGTGTREEGELFPWSGFLLKVYIKIVGSWELS